MSRDQGADVFGSVTKEIGNVMWLGDPARANTDPEDKVYLAPEIDPAEQVVTFPDYVYLQAPVAGTLFQVKFPVLTLETAVLVTEEKTGEVLRWKETLALGGNATVEWQIRDDVQVCVKGEYGPKNKSLGFNLVDQSEARKRARYYLDGAASRFRLTGGETRQYIGIWLIEPDGHVQQVTFSVGGGGAATTASTNSEHSPAVPSYPARHRAENLPPNKAAAVANLTEQQFYAFYTVGRAFAGQLGGPK